MLRNSCTYFILNTSTNFASGSILKHGTLSIIDTQRGIVVTRIPMSPSAGVRCPRTPSTWGKAGMNLEGSRKVSYLERNHSNYIP